MKVNYNITGNNVIFFTAFFALPGVAWIWWLGTFTQRLLVHGVDYLWNKQLLTLLVVSDSVIFLCYLSIALSIAWLIYNVRRQIPFVWILISFSLLILACGFTHAMDVVVLWEPFYWLAGYIKLITAVASFITAASLPFLIPRVGHLLHEVRSSHHDKRRFSAAIDGCNDAFFILKSIRDSTGEIVDFNFDFVNDHGAALVSSTLQILRGQSLCTLFPVNRTDGLFDRYKQVVNTEEPFQDEFHFNVANINASWLFLRVVKLDDGVAIMTTDISERKRLELELVQSAAFTQSIISSSPFATIVADLTGTITSVNPAAERMLGYPKEALIDGETPLLFLDSQEVSAHAARLSEELQAVIKPGISVLLAKPQRGQVEEAEWKLIRRDGSRFDAHVTVSALADTEGRIMGIILITYDITERKRAEEQLSYVASHDSMTGLPSRSLFHDRLSVSIARAKRNHNKLALLVVDVDHFKHANDLMGHHVGDELLIEVARRLQASVRASDTVARMGGDEFVLLISDLHDVHEAEFMAQNMILAMQTPIALTGHTVVITISVGLSHFPDSGENGESMLKNADLALYRAKALGRNRCQSFTYEMASASSRQRQLEVGLRDAIILNELELVYQPQISMHSNKVTGIEALLRWRSGKLGFVMPAEFIPVAEDSGLIVPIGEWVLKTAYQQARQLQLDLGRPLTLAVNISPRQFQQDHLPRVILEILAASNLDPSSLELEITERVLISDSPKALAILEEIRSFGVRLAIDDFGTGFSSMSYIMRFRVDRLKIDQSFIRNMTVDSDSDVVTTAIISLARGLNIQVVAEGVETATHRDILLAKRCDEAQGFFYSKPVPLSKLAAAIRSIEQSEVPEQQIEAVA